LEERTKGSSKRSFLYLGLQMCIRRKENKRKEKSINQRLKKKIEKKERKEKREVLWTRQCLNNVQNCQKAKKRKEW